MPTLPQGRSPEHPVLRQRLYELLEHDHLPGSAGAWLTRIIVVIVLVDITAMVLASVPDMDRRYGVLFTAIDVAALIFYTLEYAARMWSTVGHRGHRGLSPLRLRAEYAFSGVGVIDLLAFLPSWIALIAGTRFAVVLCGLLPFLKLVRYSPAMRSLYAVLYTERRTLLGCLVILLGAMLAFATLLYAVEGDVQPDKFGNIPLAMWWAIVTLGTVGYGDVVPITAIGKSITVFTIIGGFIMIALPVAIITSAFSEEIKRRDFEVTWGMLARVPLFAHLDAADISDIMRLLRTRTVERGHVLVRRGDPASSMYFITAGEVEIELPTQRVRLTDGAFFGEMALLRNAKRTGTVTATRPTRLLILDSDDLHALLERAPALAEHLQRTVDERLAENEKAGRADAQESAGTPNAKPAEGKSA